MQDKALHNTEIEDAKFQEFLNTLSENEREFNTQYILLIRQGASDDELNKLAAKYGYSSH